MKKVLPLLLIFAACNSEKPKSPRAEIARQQTELKREYQRLLDSAYSGDAPDLSKYTDEQRDSMAKAEGQFNRRITALKIKSDSLSNEMKKWEMDSIAGK